MSLVCTYKYKVYGDNNKIILRTRKIDDEEDLEGWHTTLRIAKDRIDDYLKKNEKEYKHL